LELVDSGAEWSAPPNLPMISFTLRVENGRLHELETPVAGVLFQQQGRYFADCLFIVLVFQELALMCCRP